MPQAHFHPAVQTWFDRSFPSATPTQLEAWPAIHTGRHTLIAAPTGSGKTLAAFLTAIDSLVHQSTRGWIEDATQIVYVSPLKALSNDVERNLQAPLKGISEELMAQGLPAAEIRAQVRTGDTPQTERAAMRRTPPHILVTTPESLHLLLTSVSGREMLATARTVIIDEIHAVAGNKRGAHLALSLERLAKLCPHPLQRIGLSATQKPIEEVAHFLTGGGDTSCAIVNSGHIRERDLSLMLPDAPLDAVMSNDVWQNIYDKLGALIDAHRTTLIFANTRRMVERVARHLSERLGEENVAAHHGSLSKETRFSAEQRLKAGQLRVLVATASLELGIDIGDVNLVCQLGSPRSIATFLQRVGRANHAVTGVPKGRLFPLSRDELIECTALLDAVRRGELDRLRIPAHPLDVLSQQIVSEVAAREYGEDELYELMCRAWPYRDLKRATFDEVVRMLTEGFASRRGRQNAYLHRDAVHKRLRARKGARLTALMCGGAIPDNADYRVVLEPSETFVGTLNEDFAVESQAGDIFQLGNTSYRILRVESGNVRVEDAKGQPPTLPFWLGEAPSRTDELSQSVSRFRAELDECLVAFDGDTIERCIKQLSERQALSESTARQMVDYLGAAKAVLGHLPTQRRLVFERFFDESGGMQLVIHSPFGARVNRAYGLALRKCFCRSFNFELQAAATEDAIVLSLGETHSFALADVARFLNSKTVCDILVQAMLDAPMFTTRWRWNASISLAIRRVSGGKRTPAPLQRMAAEDLVSVVFPDQLACGENLQGDREIPNHPLVQQTIEDCLHEAMDIDGLTALLEGLERGDIEVIARDLPAPSPLAQEILNAKPYAFLDDAPLEERRTQAVASRRWLDPQTAAEFGALNPQALDTVREEAWPSVENADELHDVLMSLGLCLEEEARRSGWDVYFGKLVADTRACRFIYSGRSNERCLFLGADANEERSRIESKHFDVEKEYSSSEEKYSDAEERHLDAGENLDAEKKYFDAEEKRPLSRPGRETERGPSLDEPSPPAPLPQAGEGRVFWVAAERLPMIQALYPQARIEPTLRVPDEYQQPWDATDALIEVIRGRLQVTGPITSQNLSQLLQLPITTLDAALFALEAQGFALRGQYTPGSTELEWCERRLLARIHRYTLQKLRAEIEPVSAADFMRFLLEWQCVMREPRPQGVEALASIIEQLEGFEAPAAAWESEVLPARLQDYDPNWLDSLCLSGRALWARLTVPASGGASPVRATPIALLTRKNWRLWQNLAHAEAIELQLSHPAQRMHEYLQTHGASFFDDIAHGAGLLQSQAEDGLGELVAAGVVNSDGFSGLRALVLPMDRKRRMAARGLRIARFGLEDAGRWSIVRRPQADAQKIPLEQVAWILLRRYGVVFRKLLAQESEHLPPWYELLRIYRQLEAQGLIRGGRFVAGVTGEQYALSDAIGSLRAVRRQPPSGRMMSLSAADPLNLSGILIPGPRVPALASNRLLLQDGVVIATHIGGQTALHASFTPVEEWNARNALLHKRVMNMPAPMS